MGQHVSREENQKCLNEVEKELGAKPYLPFTKEGRFEFSRSLSQHLSLLPRPQREVLKNIKNDVRKVLEYEYEFEETESLIEGTSCFILKVDMVVMKCMYYYDEETLETIYAVLEVVQGYIK